jgi:hypothetical protein
MELTIESIFTAGGLVGNLSYILLIISMAMRDIFWLRALAILSGIAGLSYDVVWLYNPVGAFWETCFILVNLFQWLWLLYEKKRSLLTPPQSLLRDQVFPVLSSLDFLKLLETASRCSFENGQVLVNKGTEVTRLYLVEHGEAIVALGDMEISRCLPGDFIGEIGFFNQVPATATVTASNNLECLMFDCTMLHRLMQKNPQLERGVTVALNANLATKLIRNNETGLAV